MNEDLGSIELVLDARVSDLGDGFTVRRALPSARRRAVGPFVFLDQMGPAVFEEGHGLDVRPHPHIGLATVTFLFEGEIMHRDSLGVVQPIRPGELNWMTAGKGIVHSERTPPHRRVRGERLFGMQAWVALPKAVEEVEPSFAHHAEGELPAWKDDGVSVRLIAGKWGHHASPAKTHSPLVYAAIELAAGTTFEVPDEYEERALYVVDGALGVGGERFGGGKLVVLAKGARPIVTSEGKTRVMLLGGAPLDAPRLIYWNFVTSSGERLVKAADAWRDDRFPPVPGETERIPLPDTPLPVPYP